MKKYTTLALIGAIVAGVAGLISIDAISATPLVTMQGASDFHESGLMIGHVTYEVRGADGLIKQYLQGDNVITRIGTNCAAKAIFHSADTICPSLGNFAYIAIGNGTAPLPSPTNTILNNTGGLNTGEIKRVLAPNIAIAPNNGAGTVVSISNTASPFTFVGLGMPLTGTTITQSGLFDAATAGNMFSIKEVAPSTGILVLPADTLGVTWAITLT